MLNKYVAYDLSIIILVTSNWVKTTINLLSRIMPLIEIKYQRWTALGINSKNENTNFSFSVIFEYSVAIWANSFTICCILLNVRSDNSTAADTPYKISMSFLLRFVMSVVSIFIIGFMFTRKIAHCDT